MNKALEQSAIGQIPHETGHAHENHAEVRRAGLLVVLAATAIALSLWFATSAGIPHVSAATEEVAMPQVPYFPSQYVNQATEPTPMPPTF